VIRVYTIAVKINPKTVGVPSLTIGNPIGFKIVSNTRYISGDATIKKTTPANIEIFHLSLEVYNFSQSSGVHLFIILKQDNLGNIYEADSISSNFSVINSPSD
jgi:hypothetical protein